MEAVVPSAPAPRLREANIATARACQFQGFALGVRVSGGRGGDSVWLDGFGRGTHGAWLPAQPWEEWLPFPWRTRLPRWLAGRGWRKLTA